MATAWESSRFPRRLHSRWARLGLALGLIVAASLGRMALGLVDARLPAFSLYIPAILAATLFGGWRTGVAATGLALLLTWVLFVRPWIGPDLPPTIAWIDMGLYGVTAALTVAVVESVNVLMARVTHGRAALSERNLHFDAVFRSMSEGFAVCEATRDEEGRLTDYVVLEMNPALQAMLGVGPEAIGRRLSDVPGDHGPWLTLCDRVLETGVPRSFENHDPATGRWHEVHVSRVTPTRMGQLFFDVTERKAAQARQAEMFDELNHRVKNNLGIVVALLNMQARAGGPALRTALGKAVDRVHSIAAVHESLSAQHRSGEVDFGAYLQNLVERLSRSILADGRIDIEVEACPWLLSIDHAVALGIVVNELVTNATKYAYPAPVEGSIRVRFRPAENGAVLTVADTGRGLPADFGGAGGALGARLVKSFVAQVGGELTIHPPPGATFDIWLPALPAAERPTPEAADETLKGKSLGEQAARP
jgi:two-component sensor histidine kinase/PAS domain-containing protein